MINFSNIVLSLALLMIETTPFHIRPRVKVFKTSTEMYGVYDSLRTTKFTLIST